MGKGIKLRLVALEKRNRDLLEELHKRGFPNLSESMLSNIIKGHYNYGMGPEVLEVIKEIIDEWEKQE